MRTTWAIVKPYINNKGVKDTCLVKWVMGDKDRAENLARIMNEEEQTNIYTVELVEMFDSF